MKVEDVKKKKKAHWTILFKGIKNIVKGNYFYFLLIQKITTEHTPPPPTLPAHCKLNSDNCIIAGIYYFIPAYTLINNIRCR